MGHVKLTQYGFMMEPMAFLSEEVREKIAISQTVGESFLLLIENRTRNTKLSKHKKHKL